MMSRKLAIIIGGGLGGLSLASLLAKEGLDVYLFEKNNHLGGRINFFQEKGYFFDMGPSWLLMDDIFDYFFKLVNKNFYEELDLIKLDPIFKIFFEDGESITFYSDISKNEEIFEKLEKNSFKKFVKYINLMEEMYFLIRDKFIFNEINFRNFFDLDLVKLMAKTNPFKNLDSGIKKIFNNEKIIKTLEFSSLFLGTDPKESLFIFGLINYFLFKRGVYYPKGGIYKIVEKIVDINNNLGVNMYTNKNVKEIIIENGRANGVILDDGEYLRSDLVISNADLYHTEMKLITNKKYRSYNDQFWKKIKIAPSAFIIYLGLNEKIDNLAHHNFYFCDDWNLNFKEIFNHNNLPTNPSFYISVASKTDDMIVPKGKEQFFILVPISAGLKITENDKYLFRDKIYKKIEEKFNISKLESLIELEKFFILDDFISLYNSFQGTALGPIHNIYQTLFRPKNKSKKVNNLYYVGSYVQPGIGMPMVIASAIITYKRILKDLTKK